MQDTLYKVFYTENGIQKCTRYGYETDDEAMRVGDYYDNKEGVTDVFIYKYETVATLVKKY